jgi:Tol biopolymer transport system component
MEVVQWSPDGHRILFAIPCPTDGGCTKPTGPAPEIRVAEPARGAVLLLGYGLGPHRSPDGTRVLYIGRTGGPSGFEYRGLNLTTADGGATVRLEEEAVWGSWSPNGASIAYVILGPTGLELHLMEPGGVPFGRLSAGGEGPTDALRIAWRPDG